MAGLRNLPLRQRQRFAGGHPQLPLHQVQPGHHLGHRVFDLQPGIDLHEPEFARRGDDELDRAGVDVVDRARGQHRGLAHAFAQLRGQERGGRLLQHLLVAALGRALALVEVDDVAVRIAEHLDLDVPRRFDVALQQHPVAAERAGGLALAALQRGQEFIGTADDAHALAAAAVGGLDHQREADAFRLPCQQVRRLVLAGIAGHHGNPGGLHQLLGTGLAAHLPHRGRLRADEHDAGRFHRFGELRVLAQEPVARMDGLRAAAPGDLQDRVAAQVAVLRPRPADRPGLVGQTHVLRAGIGFGEHRHGADAQPARGTDHPAGDLAAVGNQDRVEHVSPWPMREGACRGRRPVPPGPREKPAGRQ